MLGSLRESVKKTLYERFRCIYTPSSHPVDIQAELGVGDSEEGLQTAGVAVLPITVQR